MPNRTESERNDDKATALATLEYARDVAIARGDLAGAWFLGRDIALLQGNRAPIAHPHEAYYGQIVSYLMTTVHHIEDPERQRRLMRLISDVDARGVDSVLIRIFTGAIDLSVLDDSLAVR